MEKDQLITFDNERFILDLFRKTPLSRIRYNGRYFKCAKVERLLKCAFYRKSWIDSSQDSKPDFHNNKHHIMMDIMRVDDCVNDINGKHIPNSCERAGKYMTKHFGHNYKNNLKTCPLFFNADTRHNEEFNFKGYYENFKRVLLDHSNKVEQYRKNYPKCKTCVLFVFDESNAYYQENPFKSNNPNKKNLLHSCFIDKRFIEIIKQTKSDFVVWFAFNKSLLNSKGKEIKQPLAFIYEVQYIKNDGYEFCHQSLIKFT